jgi:uncharacterized protein (DUF1501 family)
MNTNTRRTFLRIAGLAPLARFGAMNAFASSGVDPNYKALVCIFLFGGNDGNNMIVPAPGTGEYAAYKAIRGSLALPDPNATLQGMNVTPKTYVGPNKTPAYALNDGLKLILPLWGSGQLAVIANVGLLVQPTTQAQYQATVTGGPAVPLPTNLFSHADQQVQMQAGIPSSSASTGWAGRVADAVAAQNAGGSFPPSVSVSGPALFSKGNVVQSASLIPGFNMQLNGFTTWQPAVGQTRQTQYQSILTLNSGLTMIQAADKVRQDAVNLSALLSNLPPASPFTRPFPQTDIGAQLQQVAQIMQLQPQIGLKRQIFFCSLGGFDTHSGQSWQQFSLLGEIADAMLSLYSATQDLGIANQVTTFTESEFGRTLQPSGTGCDHGWGGHQLVLGGAVHGGDIYGRYPTMAIGGPDDCLSNSNPSTPARGAWLPSTAIDQFAATLGKWFGVDMTNPGIVAQTFPNLASFTSAGLPADLGFMG